MTFHFEAQERADRIRARRQAEAVGGLVNLRAIAQEFGVTGNQVYMWHNRRHTTGFPEAIASTHRPQHPGDKRKAPLFDPDAVLTWWSTYDPNARRGAHWAAKRDVGPGPCMNPAPHDPPRGCVHHSTSGVPDRHDKPGRGDSE